MVILALGTTAPVSSVTVPEMLPFDTEVCAYAAEHSSIANKATSANSVNLAPRRRGLRFNMLCLPFGIFEILWISPSKIEDSVRSTYASAMHSDDHALHRLEEPTTGVMKSGVNLQARSM